jgi:glycosyltransferase involved in cell wall biosynthesis
MPAIKTVFLREAIQSVLSQSFSDFELIIVDGGSKENIQSVVGEYKDSRVKFYKNRKRIPIIENWNHVLHLADGEFFVLFSDDDIMENNFLKELFALTRKYPNVDIFHSRIRIINECNQTYHISPSCPEHETCADFIWHRIKNYRLHYASDFLVRTEALKKIGGFVNFPKAWCSDDATWIMLANRGGIVASSKILCNWRDSYYNISRNNRIIEKLEAVKLFHIWLNKYINNHLILRSGDNEIVEEIHKNIGFRKSVQQAFILRTGGNKGFSGMIRIFKLWLKYRRKYSLNATTLVWAIGLFIRKK